MGNAHSKDKEGDNGYTEDNEEVMEERDEDAGEYSLLSPATDGRVPRPIKIEPKKEFDVNEPLDDSRPNFSDKDLIMARAGYVATLEVRLREAQLRSKRLEKELEKCESDYERSTERMREERETGRDTRAQSVEILDTTDDDMRMQIARKVVEQRVEPLLQELSLSNEQRKALEEKIHEFQSYANRLESNLKDATALASEKEVDIRMLQADITAANEKLERRQAHLERVKEENERMEKESATDLEHIKNVEAQLKTTEKARKTAAAQVTAMRPKYEKSAARCAEQEVTIEAGRKLIESLEESVRDARARVAAMEKQMEEMRMKNHEDLSSERRKVEALTGVNGKLNAAFENYRTETKTASDEAKAEMEAVREQLAEVGGALAVAQSRISELTKEVGESRSTAMRVKEEEAVEAAMRQLVCGVMEKENEETAETTLEITRENELLQTALKQAREMCAELKQESRQWKERFDGVTSELTVMREAAKGKDELAAELARVKEEKEQKEQQRITAVADLDTCRLQVEEMEKRAIEAEASVEELQSEFDLRLQLDNTAEYKKLQGDHQTIKKEKTKMEEDNDKLRMELKEALEKAEKLEQLMHNMERKDGDVIKRVQKQLYIDTVEGKRSRSIGTRAEQRKCEELEKEKAQQQKKYEKTRRMLLAAREKIEELQGLERSWNESRASDEKEMENLRTTVKALIEKCDEAEVTQADGEKKMEEMKRSLDAAVTEVAETRRQMENHRGRRKASSSNSQRKEAGRDEEKMERLRYLEGHCNSLMEQNRQLNESGIGLVVRCRKMEEEKEKHKEKLERLQYLEGQCNSLMEQNRQLNESGMGLVVRCRKMGEEKEKERRQSAVGTANLQQELEDARRQIKELKKSNHSTIHGNAILDGEKEKDKELTRLRVRLDSLLKAETEMGEKMEEMKKKNERKDKQLAELTNEAETEGHEMKKKLREAQLIITELESTVAAMKEKKKETKEVEEGEVTADESLDLEKALARIEELEEVVLGIARKQREADERREEEEAAAADAARAADGDEPALKRRRMERREERGDQSPVELPTILTGSSHESTVSSPTVSSPTVSSQNGDEFEGKRGPRSGARTL